MKAQNVPVINATLPAKDIPPAAILDFFQLLNPSYIGSVDGLENKGLRNETKKNAPAPKNTTLDHEKP